MKRKNEFEQSIVTAYKKGYRVLPDGSVKGIRKSKLKLLLDRGNRNNSSDYYRFSLYRYDKKSCKIRVHRLAAYQKFKEAIFEEGIVVRHLDGNGLNNALDNITIGTQTQNQCDRSSEARLTHSITAATHKRKFSDEEMIEIKEYYNKVRSYKQTMTRFGITSKGSLHYMLNTKYQTKV